MSRSRVLVAGLLTAVVIGLTGWAIIRERRMADCIAEGRIWNGAHSRCDPGRGPILERDGLRRS